MAYFLSFIGQKYPSLMYYRSITNAMYLIQQYPIEKHSAMMLKFFLIAGPKVFGLD